MQILYFIKKNKMLADCGQFMKIVMGFPFYFQ